MFSNNDIVKGQKILLIYNPISGSGMFGSNLDFIIDRFQSAGYVVVPLRGAKNAMLDYVFERMAPDEYKMVVVAGGDGTINIVVNAMVRHNLELPMAIFPSGTANDFAYYFDFPHSIDEMIDIALGEDYAEVDVARVNDRYYINVAAMGNVIDVSQKTDVALKNTLGVVAYYIKGITEVTALKAVDVSIESEEYTGTEKMYFMLVMNGCSAGGFKNVSPDADISDGLLDVFVFRKMPFNEMGPLFFSVLMGHHKDNKNVLNFRTRNLKLTAAEDIPTDVDGEKGEKFPLEFSVLPGRLKLHVGRSRRPMW